MKHPERVLAQDIDKVATVWLLDFLSSHVHDYVLRCFMFKS